MNLDEGQRKKVGEWIDLGLRLSDIQERIASEMGLKLTYMDVRLLVDDLKLTPKDAETSRHVKTTLEGPATPPAAGRKETAVSDIASSKAADSVSIQLDQIARPGAVVSGKVTFSDGNKAEWYFDQMGRLGMVPQTPGYRPPTSDLQQFQSLLDKELSKMGF
jgi:hypothetical protein